MAVLLLGLGNPGLKYRDTRHNTGFHVVEKIAEKLGVRFKKKWFQPYLYAKARYEGEEFILVKPLTYMNRSGEILHYLMDKYNLVSDDLVVVVDNMDIQPGNLKLKMKGSDGGHNGLKSVNDYLMSTEYKRLFIGIGRPEKGCSVVDHVLGKINETEVYEAEDRAAEGLLMLPFNNSSQVMNYLNRRHSGSQ